MQTNRSLMQLTEPNPAGQARVSWAYAYLRFLQSRDEPMLLKVAPLALVGILPFDLISNLVPIVGEMDDLGFVIVAAFVLARTYSRVRRYR